MSTICPSEIKILLYSKMSSDLTTILMAAKGNFYIQGGGSRGSESRHPAQFYPSIPNPAKISSSTFYGISDKEKQREKTTNPASRASFIINIVSRHSFFLNPDPVAYLNPDIPPDFCAFPVIPRYFLAKSRSRFFPNPEIPLIFSANPAIPQ